MDETERANLSEGLRQGDILEIVDEEGGFDFRLATIINADCDMQNSKHDGVIAILPIYTFHEYLEKFWLPNFYLKQRNQALDLLKSVVTLEENHANELISWLQSDANAVIAMGAAKIFHFAQLGPRQIEKADEALSRLHICIGAEKRGTLDTVVQFAPSDTTKAAKFCRDQVVEAKKQIGDGHFFVTEVKGYSTLGHVVRMRRIYTIPVGNCFVSSSALQISKFSGAAAFRACKFTASYKFKVAQLFAYQFSRIGLPDDITALSDLAIADMVQHLQGKNK